MTSNISSFTLFVYDMAVMAVPPSLTQSSGFVNLLFLMLVVMSFSNITVLLISVLCALCETLERRSRFPPDRIGDNSESLNGMTQSRGSSHLFAYSVSLGMTAAGSCCPHIFRSLAELCRWSISNPNILKLKHSCFEY